MREYIQWLIPVFCAAVTGVISWFAAGKQARGRDVLTIENLQTQLRNAQAQNEGLQSRAKTLSADLAAVTGERDSVTTGLGEARTKVEQAVTVCAERDSLRSEVADLQNRLTDADKKARKYDSVKRNLTGSRVVRQLEQPVLLVGPRSVGKTSLLMQWHRPWEYSPLEGTLVHSHSVVPVYDFSEEKRVPHFADPEIEVPLDSHLVLKVHDFPGELKAQKHICQVALEETRNLRKMTRSQLGVVIICMLDASEAATGLTESTRGYYNGELFRSLRELIAHSEIDLGRLILVFNKYDILQDTYGGECDDRELLRQCIKGFSPCFDLFRDACNPEKICEAFTILDRDQMHLKSRGASIVLGEAARPLVTTVLGTSKTTEVIREKATTYAAEEYLCL